MNSKRPYCANHGPNINPPCKQHGTIVDPPQQHLTHTTVSLSIYLGATMEAP